MTALRVFYRSLFLCLTIITGCLLTVLFQTGNMTKKDTGSKVTRWWHRRMANVFSIPIRVFGVPSNDATLFIANHISWFDIIALGKTHPVRFLAKKEVGEIPVIGWLASRAGTLFIKRGSKTAAKHAIALMSETLNNNQSIILFAEGTTNDGSNIRFHSRLAQSAIDAGCTVQPIAIIYPSIDGRTTHPDALFTGGITMGQSFLKILKASTLVAELHFLQPISTVGKTRDELASYAQQQVTVTIENRLSSNK
jgi:1-acyl-sn-glycerol-3-phosphate acyltransferase